MSYITYDSIGYYETVLQGLTSNPNYILDPVELCNKILSMSKSNSNKNQKVSVIEQDKENRDYTMIGKMRLNHKEIEIFMLMGVH